MYIKRYSIAAFTLMALVGGYVYFYISKDSTGIDFFGIPLPSFAIALWVVVPLFLLYIASVLHISFYSFLGSMNVRKYEKDYDKVLDLIVDAYLGKKDREHHFKTPPYSLLGRLLDNSTIFPNKNITFKFESEKTKKMSEVLKVIEDIKNGKVVELKPYDLQMDNPLVIQNERNRYKSGELTAEALLANSQKYDETLKKEVYSDFVKVTNLVNIEKYKSLMTKQAFDNILSRVNADEFTLEISNDIIISLMADLEFTKEEYIKLSSHLSQSSMIPEQRIRLFETLSDEKEEAVDAYLYTLFDLEMITAVDEILDISQPDEYQNFKAYRALKECNKNFSIEIFV